MAPTADVSTSTTKPPRWRRWTVRIARIVVLAYIGVCLFFYFMQTSLIFPGSTTQGESQSIIRPSEDYELLDLKTADGIKVAALFGKAIPSASHPIGPQEAPTVLFFYGNGEYMADCMDTFYQLRRRGFNVIVPEYLGYGMSQGKPSESGCYAAADAAYDYLLSRPDIRHDRFVSMGWSLGGGVAVDLASRRPTLALITISTFTSIDDMARNQYPWLPVSLIVRHHFNNLAKIPRISCPILIAHGTADMLIPPQMADRLAQAAGQAATRFRVEGADHNDVLQVGGSPMWDRFAAFIRAAVGPANSP